MFRKIHILEWTDGYEESAVIGVFRRLKKAKKIKKKLSKLLCYEEELYIETWKFNNIKFWYFSAKTPEEAKTLKEEYAKIWSNEDDD